MSRPSDHGTALEAALAEVGAQVDYPRHADVARAVGRRLREDGPARRGAVKSLASARARRPVVRAAWRTAAASVAAAVVLLGAVIGVSPTARRAVADFLGLRGVKIETVPSPVPSVPSPGPVRLLLGERVTLAEARARVPFEILLPGDANLGPPDAVYLTTLATGHPHVFLAWGPRPGIPESPFTGVGLLLSQFRAEIDQGVLQKKVLGPDATVEAVEVGGEQGFFIAGRPHLLAFLDPSGKPVEDSVRLAGNVLLWERGELTLRIEAAIARDEAVRIAASVG